MSKATKKKDSHLYDFFDAIIDDNLEKKIVKLILQGYEEETIIKTLLKKEKVQDLKSSGAKR